MGTSILNIGVTGLNAAQSGLLTTGHNITNAATSGYNRQRIVQSTNTPQLSGAGFFGQGTNVTNVERVYSQYLNAQVNAASAQAAHYDSYANEIAQLDNLLADESAGLSPALQDFFTAVSEVSANPASIPARQAMLSGAESLAARFRSVESRMSEIAEGVNGQITGTVSGINSLAEQIAHLNQKIIVVQAASQGHPANDLLDQRDQLISDLNQQIRVATTSNDDGSLNVFVGSGQALVVGTQVSSLAAVSAVDDIDRIEVALQGADGALIRLPESLVNGGALGGLVAFRSETLDPAINALGRIAIGFAQSFNEQHQLGQDLTGALGTAMFSVASPVVLGSTLNTGSAEIAATLGRATDLTGSDYRLAYDGTSYTLTRLSDKTSWTSGSLAGLPPASEPQGFTLSAVSGAPAAGDTFLIQPTRQAAKDISLLISDARSIAAAAPIRTSTAAANRGTATISAGTVQSTGSLATVAPTTLTYTAATGHLSGFPATLPVTVTHNGSATTYAAGATIPYVSGDTLSFGGISVTLSGQPADGDQFGIAANTQGVSDNRNALLLGQLQTAKTLIGGTASYQSAYSQIVSGVGNKAREVEVGLTAQQNLVKQAEEAQQSLSGVNLDEEAANLLRYQQMFQASSKVIDIASKLFEQILTL